MSGRIPEKFVLKRKDKTRLLELLHDGQTPLKVARRALILLGRATDEQSIAALEDKVEQVRLISPPYEMPAMCACLISRASNNAARSSACCSMLYGPTG